MLQKEVEEDVVMVNVDVEKVVVEEEDEDEEDGNDITLERYIKKWNIVKGINIRRINSYCMNNLRTNPECSLAVLIICKTGGRPGSINKGKEGGGILVIEKDGVILKV